MNLNTCVVMNIEQRFEQAALEYQPQDGDNPENMGFYRAAHGLCAVWGQDAHMRYAWVHQAMCQAGDVWRARERGHSIQMTPYQMALAVLRANMEKPIVFIREPYRQYSHLFEPAMPTEADARAEFNRQWKAKFPGKRANSKEANAKYAEVKDKAMQIVMDEYKAKLEAYKAEQARIEAENAKRYQEWLDQFHAIALVEDWARGVLAQQ